MKNITYLIAFLLTCNWGFGQTTLSAGDIVITGFNSDNPDEFSFVLLTDVATSTVIKFTDNGWEASGEFRDNEGTIEWTATTDLPCGTEIVITDNSPFSSTLGSVTDDYFFSFSASGDQILAYQGADASPTFIYAVNFDGSGWATDATSSNNSALPTGLTNGVNAVAINEVDNSIYDCSVTSDTSLVLAAVSNSSNWSGSDSTRQTIGGCTYSCGPCSGGTTTWDGSSWDNGTPDLTTEAVLNGNYDTATNSSFSACSLTVNSGATLNIADNDYVEVQNDLTVNTGGEILVQPYGAFIQNNDSGAVNNSGYIEVAKETAPIDVWYEYTYWSSPVSNTTVEDALSASDASRRFIFNASEFNDAYAETANDNNLVFGLQDGIDDEGNDWQWVDGSTLMTPGVGYAATHSEIAMLPFPGINYKYTFVGDFNNGEIKVPVSRNDVTTADKNWNFIGNPYPSAISITAFLAQNMYPAGPLEGVVYFWSQNTNYSATANGNQALNFNTNDYAYSNGIGGTVGGDGLEPNGYIPSGQGFFISFSDSYPSNTGSAVFNNAMRSLSLLPDNSQFFKNTTKTKKEISEVNKLWVNLTSDNGVFNQILIGYVDGATNGYDGSYYDADKIVAPTAYAALYSSIEDSDKKFVIQGKAASSLNENETIALGFKTNIEVPTLYTLSLAKIQGDFLSGSPVYLKDNLLNKVHDLSVSDYTFTSEVGEFNERFVIGFSNNTLSTDTALTNDSSLKIVALDNDYVQFSTSNDLQIKSVAIYDLLGRALYNFKGSSSSETYKLSNLKSSVFLAKVELSNGAVISKKAVKK